MDFPLTAKRDVAAARRFFKRAIDQRDVPEKVTVDKSGANPAVVSDLVGDSGLTIDLKHAGSRAGRFTSPRSPRP